MENILLLIKNLLILRVKKYKNKIPILGKIISEKDSLLIEKEVLLKEKDDLLVERYELISEKDKLQENFNLTKIENTKLLAINKTFLVEKNYCNVLLKLASFLKKDPSYKIKVAFLVSENQKWNSQSLYEELEKNPKFEPVVLVTKINSVDEKVDRIKEIIEDNYGFFKKRGMRVKKAYDVRKNNYINLSEFEPDIVFYQQPWGIEEGQNILVTSQFALCCYVPYSFKLFDYENNYLPYFHGLLWKYFVKTGYHLDLFSKKYLSKNCVVTGYPKLDVYLNKTKNVEMWKISKNKNMKIKRIIYAPHHSIVGTPLKLSTFLDNSEFILNLARNTKNTEWIFKPHPNLKYNFLQAYPEKRDWIVNYFKEWSCLSNSHIYDKGDYFDIFRSSDVLITDCGSFLAEYLPTEKPVIHLRTKEQNFSFNEIGQEIINNYYQAYNLEDINNIFNDVVIKGDDYLKEERIKSIKLLMIDKKTTAACRIIDYLSCKLFF